MTAVIIRIFIYGDRQSYDEPLVKDNFVSTHRINRQCLPIELFKIKKEMPPKIVSSIFMNRTVTKELLHEQFNKLF